MALRVPFNHVWDSSMQQNSQICMSTKYTVICGDGYQSIGYDRKQDGNKKENKEDPLLW